MTPDTSSDGKSQFEHTGMFQVTVTGAVAGAGSRDSAPTVVRLALYRCDEQFKPGDDLFFFE